MSTHGPQHDVFPSHGSQPHGAQFDAGFGLQQHVDTHGPLHDLFGVKPGRVRKHGERWDDFPWKDMPAKHGQLFDSDFSQPSALGDGEHGTWHDVFRGARVRYLYEGKAYEGPVINTEADHAVIKPSSSANGETHQVGLGQILAIAMGAEDHPTDSGAPDRKGIKTAEPGNTPAPIPASTADAPSAHDATASGGHLPVAGGKATQPGGTGTTVANKTHDDDADVAKGKAAAIHDSYSWAHSVNHQHGSTAPMCSSCSGTHANALGGTIAPHATGGPCKGCGSKLHPHPSANVTKSVDATETAVQSQGNGGASGKAWCKKCKHYCRRDKDGKCPTCGGAVAIRKSDDEILDVLKGLAAA